MSTPADRRSEIDHDRLAEGGDVSDALERILGSDEFLASERMSSFLRYVVSQVLAGRSDHLKQYTIAKHVFGRSGDFRPEADPVVRVQAAKVRRALERYYLTAGKDDPVRLEIPKGTYVPTFTRRETRVGQDLVSAGSVVIRPRIAVASFTSWSGDPTKDYLASGFREDLSTELSRFRGISVVACNRNQQCQQCDGDVCQLGREVGANYLLCGSLRKSASDLLVNVQLFSTSDGVQVWAERFRKQFTKDDLFEIQDGILHSILAQVAGTYGAVYQEVAQATRRRENAGLTGYEAVLRSLHYDKTLHPDDYADAVQALESAIQSEPDFAPTWARLAILYLDSVAFGMDTAENAIQRGIEYAERALTLDSNSQDAHYAMAWACLLQRDAEGVANSARKIIDLNPGEAYLVGVGGWFLALSGRRSEGMEIIEHARRLNSNCPSWFHFIPYLEYFDSSDYHAAIYEAEQLRMPDFFWDPLLKAAALGQLGRIPEAREHVDKLLSLRPDFAERAAHFVGCFVLSDDLRQRILDGLDAAGLTSEIVCP